MDTMWVFLLCLQGCLLTHALDCTGKGRKCSQGTEVKLEDEAISSLLRIRRQAHSQGAHHNLPGSYSVKGSPNTLIQTDRSRRHLNANKKKPHRPRVGSFSLLTHNHAANPLQVVSAQRHFENVAHLKVAPVKSMKKRSRRSVPKKKKNSRNFSCS